MADWERDVFVREVVARFPSLVLDESGEYDWVNGFCERLEYQGRADEVGAWREEYVRELVRAHEAEGKKGLRFREVHNN